MNKKLFLLIPACLLVLAACTPKQGGSGAGSSGETSGDASSGSSEEEHCNFGTLESPLTISQFVTEVAKLELGFTDASANKGEYSPNFFFVRGELADDITGSADSWVFHIKEGESQLRVSSAKVQQGKVGGDYMPGDVLIMRAYARASNNATNDPLGYYLSYNNGGETGKNNPEIVACTPATRPAVTGVTLNSEGTEAEPVNLRQGDSVELKATLAPKYAVGTVNWTVARVGAEDDAKVTLSATTGMAVTATADGAATIGAKYKVTASVAETEFKAEAVFEITSSSEHIPVPTIVDTPVVGTKYKLGVKTSMDVDGDKALKADYFIKGTISGSSNQYVDTVTDWDTAVDVELVAGSTEGKYKLKVTYSDSSVKYMNFFANGDYTNVKFETEASSIEYSYDAAAKTLFATVGGHTQASKDGDFFLGTYYNSKQSRTYNTLQTSYMSYIQGDKAANIDAGGNKAQYPVHFWALV